MLTLPTSTASRRPPFRGVRLFIIFIVALRCDDMLHKLSTEAVRFMADICPRSAIAGKKETGTGGQAASRVPSAPSSRSPVLGRFVSMSTSKSSCVGGVKNRGGAGHLSGSRPTGAGEDGGWERMVEWVGEDMSRALVPEHLLFLSSSLNLLLDQRTELPLLIQLLASRTDLPNFGDRQCNELGWKKRSWSVVSHLKYVERNLGFGGLVGRKRVLLHLWKPESLVPAQTSQPQSHCGMWGLVKRRILRRNHRWTGNGQIVKASGSNSSGTGTNWAHPEACPAPRLFGQQEHPGLPSNQPQNNFPCQSL